MNFGLLAPKEQLVRIMNRIYHGGLTTLSGGNLSIRDENGDIWITPAGVDKGRLTPKDIILIKSTGEIIGAHRPSSEFPFHQAIYQARPDIHAIVHAHSPALVSFSIARQIPNTSLIPQAQQVCGEVGYAPYALPGSEMLGERIAAAFAKGFHVVLLENHGVATVGENLLEAFQRLETLNFCARTQIYAQGLGAAQVLSSEQINLFYHRPTPLPEFTPASPSSLERELRQDIVEMVHRACQRDLMISTEGVISARMNENSFLITPTAYDRPSISLEDVVLIQDSQREAGKLPSRSVKLHQAIYSAHPEINAVITAQAPYVMAYAVTEHPLDTKTIPESYVMLLNVAKLPYNTLYQHPEQVAERLSSKQPVLILQNDCVLTTGHTLLQAFDRLEVAEFTARSLIETANIGALVPIETEAIHELERAFAL